MPRIFTFPDWAGNPYLAMLQVQTRGAGIRHEGTAYFADLLAELRDPDARGVFHLHWPSPVTDRARSQEEADERVDAFLFALATARAARRPIVWTIHNTLPHDTAFHASAARLHQGIADTADLIHVLNPATAQILAEEARAGEGYVIDPAKVRVIEHSSYLGVYGTRLDAGVARKEIGAAEDSHTVLHFGQLRPYKGVERLFAAFADLGERGAELELLLAGKPAPQLAPELLALEQSPTRVTAALRFIDDTEVAGWFSAAQVAVLPYERVLNSGTAHLAATFGVPVVLPAEPALLAQFAGQDWVRFFDPADAARSIGDLLLDQWYAEPAVVASADAFARTHSPQRMAAAYADLIDEAARLTSRR